VSAQANTEVSLDALTQRLVELASSPTPPVEEIGQVAELIAARRAADARALESERDYVAPRYAKTSQMCRELGFERTWAYGHRAQLGARVMGDGPKARMRFDMEVARAFWASLSLTEAVAPAKTKQQRRSRSKSRAQVGGTTRAGNKLLEVPSWSI
jgi:hypothetical protein